MSTLMARLLGAAALTVSAFALSSSLAVGDEGNRGGDGSDGEAFWRWRSYGLLLNEPAAAEAVEGSRVDEPPPAAPVSVTPRRPVRVGQRRRTGPSTAPVRTAVPRPATGRAPGERFVADEVLVQPRANVSAEALDRLAGQNRLTRIAAEDLALIGPLHRFRIDDGRSPASVARRLTADRRVASAQPNFLFELQQPAVPATTAQYGLIKLRLSEAHRVSRGSDVLIAVIDSGIDAAHPELAGVLAGSVNVADGEPQPHAHGTAMAGTIAARGQQLTGVAPAARLLGIRAFSGDAGASGASGTSYHVVKALDWAHQNKARVANLSFAGPRDPLLSRTLKAARERGMVLIAAAGNAGPKSPPLYPAADSNVIAVTAIDADDRLYPAANRGRHIAVAAPGVDVLVAAPRASYGLTSGTSVAAAHVSGLAALLIERKPDLDLATFRSVLSAGARDLGPAGIDEEYGAGIPDAAKALDLLAPKTAVRTQ